jgi:hypothetical protein
MNDEASKSATREQQNLYLLGFGGGGGGVGDGGGAFGWVDVPGFGR